MKIDASIALLVCDHGPLFPLGWAVYRAEDQPDEPHTVRLEIKGDGLPDRLLVPTLQQTTATVTWEDEAGVVLGVVEIAPRDVRVAP